MTMAQQLCRQLGRVGALSPHLLRVPQSYVVPSASKVTIWEKDPKSGYRQEKQLSWDQKKAVLKEGLQDLKHGFGDYMEEMKEKFRCDVNIDIRHGDYMYVWKLNDREEVDKWIVTADRDNNEGKSSADLVLTKTNTAIFHGYLCQEVPKDGIIKTTGYCQMKSPPNLKAFKRKEPHDWSDFNCLLLKVRGDGRTYMVTLGIERMWDVNWSDQYHFPLYTRGGPYWQITKIPFSKFYLATKGRIQDKQEPVDLTRISWLGISLGDGNEGPFQLEVDSFAIQYDENHTETFAYELYQAKPEHVGT